VGTILGGFNRSTQHWVVRPSPPSQLAATHLLIWTRK
jgi:hypothetical protein